PQLEVAVVLRRLQALALAVVVQDAVLDGPVRQVLFVRLPLLLGEFFGGQLGPLRQLDESLPVVEVLAVEQRLEPFRRSIVLGRPLFARTSLDREQRENDRPSQQQLLHVLSLLSVIVETRRRRLLSCTPSHGSSRKKKGIDHDAHSRRLSCPL